MMQRQVNQAGPNQAQAAQWNSRGGEVWVSLQAMLDRLFFPFEQVLADAVRASGARQVLDIGCGAGATTIAVARVLGERGSCTGVDISAPLIEAARRRAVANADFVVADAQSHGFAPASFDAIVSRFGVMFFDDPEAAFANLRRAARDNAEMVLVAWRSPDDNPFMVAAERAAAPLLPQLPPRHPDAPGQFGFANAERVRGILSGAWRDVDIQPLDMPCSISVADLEIYARSMGRAGLVLPDLDEASRTAVLAAIRDAFVPYISEGVARFNAACWLIRARA
jgi:SAM-dependent methyltransferase